MTPIRKARAVHDRRRNRAPRQAQTKVTIAPPMSPELIRPRSASAMTLARSAALELAR